MGVGDRGLVGEVGEQVAGYGRGDPHPDRALSDGAQSLYPEQFDRLMKEVRLIAEAIGRRVAEPAGARA